MLLLHLIYVVFPVFLFSGDCFPVTLVIFDGQLASLGYNIKVIHLVLDLVKLES